MKRWVKELGNPIMALVILTEPRPYEAVGTVLRRLAFLMLPLSVLFLRYYPELGRSYHADGSPMFTGVGHQKNDLGSMCLMAGYLCCLVELLQRRENKNPRLCSSRDHCCRHDRHARLAFAYVGQSDVLRLPGEPCCSCCWAHAAHSEEARDDFWRVVMRCCGVASCRNAQSKGACAQFLGA